MGWFGLKPRWHLTVTQTQALWKVRDMLIRHPVFSWRELLLQVLCGRIRELSAAPTQQEKEDWARLTSFGVSSMGISHGKLGFRENQCYVMLRSYFHQLSYRKRGPPERSYPLWPKIVTISMECSDRGVSGIPSWYIFLLMFGDPRFAGREHLRNTFQGKTWFPGVSCRFFIVTEKPLESIYTVGNRWVTNGKAFSGCTWWAPQL